MSVCLSQKLDCSLAGWLVVPANLKLLLGKLDFPPSLKWLPEWKMAFSAADVFLDPWLGGWFGGWLDGLVFVWLGGWFGG